MKRETFTDMETGREIESTWLARLISGLVNIRVLSLLCMILVTWNIFPGYWIDPSLLSLYILFGLTLISLYEDLKKEKLHDIVARWQDRRREERRQRRLLWRATRHIPDGALSRAQPPSEPQPTAVSLSLADAPEEKKSMLVSAVEEAETYETVTVSA